MDYDIDDITPARVIRVGNRWLPVVLFAIVTSVVLFAIVCLITWPLHVWLFSREVNLQNNVYQNSYGTQQSDIGSMETAIQAIPGAFGNAQVRADVNQACGYGAKVNQLPPGDASWFAQNCSGPVISPTSSYNTSDGAS